MGALYDTYVEVYLNDDKVVKGISDLGKRLKKIEDAKIKFDDTYIRRVQAQLNEIDQRVLDVGLGVDTSNVERASDEVTGLQRAADDLDGKQINIGVDTSNIENARNALDGVNSRIGGLLKATSALAVTGGAGFVGMANAALGMMRQVENATFLLKTYTGSAQQASNITAELVQYAQSDMGVLFQRGDLLDAAANLAIYGDKAANLTNHVKILSKGVALGKTTFQELSDVLGRVGAAGKLTGNDFDLLVARGIRLDDKMRNAKVTFDQLFTALDKALPAGVLEGRVQSIEGRTIRLKSAFRNLGLEILGVETVVDEFGNMVTRFAEGGAGDRLMKFLEDLASTLRSPEVKEGFNKVGVELMKLATQVFPLVLKAITLVATNFDKLIVVVKALAVAFVVTKLGGYILAAADALMKLKAALAAMSKASMLAKAGPFIFVAAVLAVLAVLKGLYDRSESFRAAVKRLADIFGDLGAKIVNAFGGTVTKAIDSFMNGIERGWNKIAPAVNGLIDFLDIIVNGDFKKGMFGGVSEDSKIVDMAFRVRDAIKATVDFIKDVAQKAWETFGETVKTVADFVFDFIQLLATGDFKKGMFDGMEDSKIVDFVLDLREGIIKLYNTIKDTGAALADYFGPTIEKAGNFIQNTLIPAFKKAWELLKDDLGPAIKEVGETIKENFGPTLKSLKDAFEDVWPAFQEAWKEIGPALKTIAKIVGGVIVLAFIAWVKQMKYTLKFVAFVIKAIAKYIQMMAPVWGAIIKAILWVAEKAAWWFNNVMVPGYKALWEGLVAAWGFMQPIFQAIWDFVSIYIIPIFKLLWEQAVFAWNVISTAISLAWNNVIKPIWDIIWTYVQTVMIPMWKLIWEVIKQQWENISGAISFAWNNVIKPIWDIIWGYITNVLVPTWKKIWDIAKFVWDNVSSTVSSAWNRIQPVLSAIKNFITGTVIPAFQRVWEIARMVWSNISNVVSNAINTIKGVINSALEPLRKFADLMKKAGDAIKNAPSKIKSFIPGFAEGTNFAPGGWSWVGERGPELLKLPRGTQVKSHQDSVSMVNNQPASSSRPVANGQSGDTFIIHGVSADQVVAKIQAYQKRKSVQAGF